MFIVFEGIDGSGKSEQARLLAEFFEFRGIPFILTREPSDGIVGKKLRNLVSRLQVEEESRLFLEDRIDHVQRIISPALKQGRHVICDRYYYSSAAYQGARGLDPVEILNKNRAVVPEPDIVFLLVVCVETALKRISESRSGGLSIFEKKMNLEAVADIYCSFQDPIIIRIDGEGSMAQVHAQVLDYLKLKGVEV
ncbi:MAG: dTMP kinase [Desulfomonilaceae bacterium]